MVHSIKLKLVCWMTVCRLALVSWPVCCKWLKSCGPLQSLQKPITHRPWWPFSKRWGITDVALCACVHAHDECVHLLACICIACSGLHVCWLFAIVCYIFVHDLFFLVKTCRRCFLWPLSLTFQAFGESICHCLQKYCLNYSKAILFLDTLKAREDFTTYVKVLH